MQNGGQTCISVERVYVEEPVYDEFVAKVDRERSRALRQGVPAARARSTSARSRSRRRRTSSSATSSDAVDEGRAVLVGGHARRRPGRFYEPTVLVDVDHSMEA
jgi:acyl-CoA reductase-like NAD-dependent aldehyde dehydrogenase